MTQHAPIRIALPQLPVILLRAIRRVMHGHVVLIALQTVRVERGGPEVLLAKRGQKGGQDDQLNVAHNAPARFGVLADEDEGVATDVRHVSQTLWQADQLQMAAFQTHFVRVFAERARYLRHLLAGLERGELGQKLRASAAVSGRCHSCRRRCALGFSLAGDDPCEGRTQTSAKSVAYCTTEVTYFSFPTKYMIRR